MNQALENTPTITTNNISVCSTFNSSTSGAQIIGIILPNITVNSNAANISGTRCATDLIDSSTSIVVTPDVATKKNIEDFKKKPRALKIVFNANDFPDRE